MSMNRFDEIKALAFDHYGTLFDKHAISELSEAEGPGHGLEGAESWYLTTKEYCWLNGMMERHQTWDDLTKRALAYVCEKRDLALADDLHERLIEADLLLPPYHEVPAALARLAACFDLYVLSMGSANFGFPTAWVNRTGEPLDKLGPVPDLVVPDLERLAEVLGA